MASYVYRPVRWNREAEAAWAAGWRDEAVKRSLASMDGNPEPDSDTFIQPGFYLFQLERYEQAVAVFERGLAKFPDHPMILLSLGSSYNRWGRHKAALPLLERFLASGHFDAGVFDALASSNEAVGELVKARLFGTMALTEKDRMTRDRHGMPALRPPGDVASRRRVIAFTLFGSHPRYLRGALQNILAARDLYPGWTCRFYVDDSVDATFRAVIADEGAEVVMDESGDADVRHRLSRRFLVSDEPGVGYFLVRDCDSVVGPREAAAVAEWIESGRSFHVMRDWYTHTDSMLAGMWGGIAGMFPDMSGTIARFRQTVPISINWDQYFLRDQVWPAIRDDCMVHDRLFGSHAARAFPTPTPPGREHVGINQYAAGKGAQAAALAAYAERIPALGLARSVKLDFNLG